MLRAEWTDDTDRWVQYVRREFEKIQREKDDEDLIRAVLEADIYLDDRDRWVKSVRSKLEELRRNRY